MHPALLLYQRTRNLGDDMQTLAAERLLRASGMVPVGWVDRERISRPGREGMVPMSAWWKLRAADWPPAPGIAPVAMGLHLASEDLVAGHEDWWRRWGPVGCRDRHSTDLLRRHGIEAWWSGCVTLTLSDWSPEEWTVDPEREERLADALLLPLPPLDASPTTVLADLGTTRGAGPASLSPDVVAVSHQLRPVAAASLSLEDRLYLAGRLMTLYHRARTLVTTRLHAYLPALAMGRSAVLLGPRDARTRDYGGIAAACPGSMAAAFREEFDRRVILRGGFPAPLSTN